MLTVQGIIGSLDGEQDSIDIDNQIRVCPLVSIRFGCRVDFNGDFSLGLTPTHISGAEA